MVYMDLNIEKELKNGLNFYNIFRTIIIYSLSIFIGFFWKDLITETITAYMPVGTNLTSKYFIGISITMFLVCFCYFIMKLEWRSKDNAKS